MIKPLLILALEDARSAAVRVRFALTEAEEDATSIESVLRLRHIEVAAASLDAAIRSLERATKEPQ